MSANPANSLNFNATIKDSDMIERADSSASSTSSWDLLNNEPTTVIDLGNDDEPGMGGALPGSTKTENDFMEAMRSKIIEEVGGQVLAAGKSQARRFFDLYSNIDHLRPYFDVEPKDVVARLGYSVIPQKPGKPQTVPGELYGPLMVVFTLIAVLLFSMKYSNHTVQEGTLMGTAIGVCFGYWLGGSGLYYFIAYLCNAHITLLQIVSLTGYALFSHVVCIFIATVTHEASHGLFLFTLILVGGLSSLKMVCVYVSRTWSRKHGLITGAFAGSVHLLFLVYLHYAYHATYEEAAHLMEKTGPTMSLITMKT